ncbi:MAG: lysozyme inhibitor LprI family protein [Acidithiobacillus sp.]
MHSTPARSDAVPIAGLLFLALNGTPLADAASFNCNNPSNSTEKAICADPQLDRLDREHNRISKELIMRMQQARNYTQALQYVQDSEEKWKKERNACRTDPFCITDAYARRLAVLNTCFYPDRPAKTTPTPESPSAPARSSCHKASPEDFFYWAITDAETGGFRQAKKPDYGQNPCDAGNGYCGATSGNPASGQPRPGQPFYVASYGPTQFTVEKYMAALGRWTSHMADKKESCVPFCLRDMLRDSAMKTRIADAKKRLKFMSTYVYQGCKKFTSCYRDYKTPPEVDMNKSISEGALKKNGFTDLTKTRELLTRSDKWRWVVWQIQDYNASKELMYKTGDKVYTKLFDPETGIASHIVENDLGMRVNEYNPPHFSHYSVNQYLYYGIKHAVKGKDGKMIIGGPVWVEARNHFASAAVFAPDSDLERVSMQFFASADCFRYASMQEMNLAGHGYTGKNGDDTHWVFSAAKAWNGSGQAAIDYANTTVANYKKLRGSKELQERMVCDRSDQSKDCH